MIRVKIYVNKITCMDSITQVVLSAAVGESCLGKKSGGAKVSSAAVATIPDLDVAL